MNLDHEAASTIVVMKLYMANTTKAMLWTEKCHFFVYKLWIQAIRKTINGLSLEVVASKQLWIGPNH
jgi:hypothetical protein